MSPMVPDLRLGNAHGEYQVAAAVVSLPLRPIKSAAQFDIMFWLPPGGTDNGVWASNWAELADLEPTDVAPLLSLLADADVGGYVATPGGRSARTDKPISHRLWVDSLRYHKAEDVLMTYLHSRNQHGRC
jgi:hypothetical protein